MPIIDKISELVGSQYDFNNENSASYRIISDHLRSCSFLLAQGVVFDRVGCGYVLRRIMRRAIRHGYILGFREPFMYRLVDSLIEIMGPHYNYLYDKSSSIKDCMKAEEKKFFNTIKDGIKLFNKELSKSTSVFSGDMAYKLFDTYGFPLDLTKDMLRGKNIKIDIDTFNVKMNEQKQRSRNDALKKKLPK